MSNKAIVVSAALLAFLADEGRLAAKECGGLRPEKEVSRSERDLYRGKLEAALKRGTVALKCSSSSQEKAEAFLQRSRIYGFMFFLQNRGLESAIEDVKRAEQELLIDPESPDLLAKTNLQHAFLAYAGSMISGSADFSEAQQYLGRVQPAQLSPVLQSDYWLYQGLILENIGSSVEARDAYEKSYAAATMSGNKLSESYAIRHLGLWLLANGKPQAALPWLRKSLQLREEIEFEVYLPFSVHSVGKAHAALGERQQAAAYFKRAERLARKLHAPRVRSFILIDWAVSLKNDRGRAETKKMLTRARDIADSIGYRSGSMRARQEVATLGNNSEQRSGSRN
jgi:tetratricopeptide (TPR) repeat protein